MALIAGIIFLAFGLTHGVADAGNRFLSQIGAGKINEAYEGASATLKSQQTSAEFEESVKKLAATGVDGVPEIIPVVALRVKPAGSVPEVTDHVKGAVPPWTKFMRFSEKGVPAFATCF